MWLRWGGVRPDASKALSLKTKRDAAADEAWQRLKAIEGLGVRVKDLATGLIGFPTLYHGRGVLLCFRLGAPLS